MKFFSYLTGILLFYFVMGFYISQNDLSVIPAGIEPANYPGYFDYRGVTNVRTELSAGSSSPDRVIEEGRLAELDYLFITDLNQYNAQDAYSGYNGNLLVFQEGEYNFLDSRVTLYSGSKPKTFSNSSEVQFYLTDYLSRATTQGSEGFVVLNRPFNPNEMWIGNYPTGLDGIEVINPGAISQKAWIRSKADVIWSLLMYPFNPRYAFLRLYRDPIEELTLWDKLSQERPTLGFSGADASAKAIPATGYTLRFPSYKVSFEIASNHVLLNSELTGNYQKDRAKLYNALKAGNFYMSIDLLGNPKGFMAILKDDGKTYPMGSKIKFSSGQRIRVHLPHKPQAAYEIIVLKNGERVFAISEGLDLDYKVESPGVYRIYVRVIPQFPIPDGKKWIGWIFSNPFFVN